MGFAAVVSILPIIGKGLAGVFAVIIVIWGLVATLTKVIR